MKEYRKILTRAGVVLVFIGIADIVFMAYNIAVLHKPYSSSYNIFAVVAGIFLIMGNLNVARVVSCFMALFIAASIGGLIIMPFLTPLDLIAAYLRVKPFTAFRWILFGPVSVVLFIWIYRCLTSRDVVAAMDKAGVNRSFWRAPKIGFLMGGCIPLVAMLMSHCLDQNSETANEAKRRAALEVGAGHEYYVKYLTAHQLSSGQRIHAVVIAYNKEEIKDVSLNW